MQMIAWHQAAMCVASAAIGSALYASFSNAPRDEVKATRFILIDEDGDAQAAFELEDGTPRFSVDGKASFSLGPEVLDVSELRVKNDDGEILATLGLLAKDYPAFALFRPGGDVAVQLAIGSETGLQVWDTDPKEAPNVKLTVSDAGRSGLFLLGRNEQELMAVAGSPSGASLLTKDTVGSQRVTLMGGMAKKPNLFIVDDEGNQIDIFSKETFSKGGQR